MTGAVAAALIAPFAPRIGLILGSGLGAVAHRIETAEILPYSALPGFPETHVAGHPGRLLLGRLGGVRVACLQGRAHYYETGSAAAMAMPIRALRRAGAEILILTNAAGSLRPEFGAGRIMMIEDHINFIPGNPLVGPNDDEIGLRFPSLRDAYDPALRAAMAATAERLGIALATGIYLAYSGPSFETPAEIRAFRHLGADAVGMSTVPEAILARHCGLRVLALSVITNLAEGLGPSPSHDQTLAAAEAAAATVTTLLENFCAGFADAP